MKASVAVVSGVLGAMTFGAGESGAQKLQLPLGLQEQAAFIPDDNPGTPEKIALGKQFFWDRRWSKSGTVACRSCTHLGTRWTASASAGQVIGLDMGLEDVRDPHGLLSGGLEIWLDFKLWIHHSAASFARSPERVAGAAGLRRQEVAKDRADQGNL